MKWMEASGQIGGANGGLPSTNFAPASSSSRSPHCRAVWMVLVKHEPTIRLIMLGQVRRQIRMKRSTLLALLALAVSAYAQPAQQAAWCNWSGFTANLAHSASHLCQNPTGCQVRAQKSTTHPAPKWRQQRNVRHLQNVAYTRPPHLTQDHL